MYGLVNLLNLKDFPYFKVMTAYNCPLYTETIGRHCHRCISYSLYEPSFFNRLCKVCQKKSLFFSNSYTF